MAQMTFDGTELKEIEWTRTARLVTIGTCLAGPVSWKLYKNLSSASKTLEDFASKAVKYELMTSPLTISSGVGFIGYIQDLDWSTLGLKVLKEAPFIFAASFFVACVYAALVVRAVSPVTSFVVNIINSVMFWTCFSFISNGSITNKATEEDNKTK